MSEKIDFEKSLSELEKIVEQLEKGNNTLDESIELFSKGVYYTKLCNKCLENAKMCIVSLDDITEGK